MEQDTVRESLVLDARTGAHTRAALTPAERASRASLAQDDAAAEEARAAARSARAAALAVARDGTKSPAERLDALCAVVAALVGEAAPA